MIIAIVIYKLTAPFSRVNSLSIFLHYSTSSLLFHHVFKSSTIQEISMYSSLPVHSFTNRLHSIPERNFPYLIFHVSSTLHHNFYPMIVNEHSNHNHKYPPAPFNPSSPKHSPRSTANETPRTVSLFENACKGLINRVPTVTQTPPPYYRI